MILAFSRPPFRLGNSIWVLLFAYIVRALPLMFNYIQAGYKQIGVNLEEASRSVGASQISTARRVTIPLLLSTILPISGLIFVLNFRDLDASIFLSTRQTPVVAVTLFDLSEDGVVQLMGAFAMLILLCNFVIAGAIALLAKYTSASR